MRLQKTIAQGKTALTICVDYDSIDRTVTEINYAVADNGHDTIDITHILSEHFNLDEVVDKIDWAEIVAEMEPPVEDDDEEGWRE